MGDESWNESSIDTNSYITEEERKVGKKPNYKADCKVRESSVAWSNDQWLYDLIWPYMSEANELSGWRFDISSAETIQITKYEKNGFYGFHKDGSGDHLSAYDMPDNKFMHGNVRKISMSVFLNDDYEGGEFQFANCNHGKCDPVSPNHTSAGSMVIFPSFCEHRVKPVKSGTRYSLVAWFLGPPFK